LTNYVIFFALKCHFGYDENRWDMEPVKDEI